MSAQITLDWKKDSTFETQMDGHTVTIDTSKEDGGTGSGVRPKALMLVALAVKAETTDTVPMLYSAFFITFHVTGKAEESARIEKAIRLSQEYCGVSAMMKKIGPVTHRILLNGSELNIQPTDK